MRAARRIAAKKFRRRLEGADIRLLPQTGDPEFLLLLFFLARPVSVWLGLMGATGISRDQRLLISWFGIRGVGSIF